MRWGGQVRVMDPVQTTVSGVLTIGILSLAGVVKYLYSEMGKLRDAERECGKRLSASESDNASLRSELTSFMAMLDQQRADGVITTKGLEASFVVNAKTRRIRDWNVGASIVLGWDRRDILRQMASVLIPDFLSDDTKLAWENLYVTDRAPARGPFKVRVLDKGGCQIAMDMTLSAWQDDQETLIAATLRRRDSDSDTKDVGSQ